MLKAPPRSHLQLIPTGVDRSLTAAARRSPHSQFAQRQRAIGPPPTQSRASSAALRRPNGSQNNTHRKRSRRHHFLSASLWQRREAPSRAGLSQMIHKDGATVQRLNARGLTAGFLIMPLEFQSKAVSSLV